MNQKSKKTNRKLTWIELFFCIFLSFKKASLESNLYRNQRLDNKIISVSSESLRLKFSLLNKIAKLVIELNISVIYNLFQDMFVQSHIVQNPT